jgi:hypothetical protein
MTKICPTSAEAWFLGNEFQFFADFVNLPAAELKESSVSSNR